MVFQPVGQVRQIAELECVVVDPVGGDFQPQTVVVLCHGFGAPGTDLVDCCRAMWELEAEALRDTRFVFPAAPMQLDDFGYGDARAWWPIDMVRLNEMIASGQIRDLRGDKPPMLDQRRRQLSDLALAVAQECDVELSAVVLGGFSQGAMLATDVALHLDDSVGGLIIWSGTLLNEVEWKSAMLSPRRFPVFQSHGRYDPILPYVAAEWLHQMWKDAGYQAEFVPFDGMHEIPMPAMRGAARLVANVAVARKSSAG